MHEIVRYVGWLSTLFDSVPRCLTPPGPTSYRVVESMTQNRSVEMSQIPKSW